LHQRSFQQVELAQQKSCDGIVDPVVNPQGLYGLALGTECLSMEIPPGCIIGCDVVVAKSSQAFAVCRDQCDFSRARSFTHRTYCRFHSGDTCQLDLGIEFVISLGMATQ
jgi:hypothetical protein